MKVIKEPRSIKISELQSDLICMNLIKRKIKKNYILNYNDEQLILIIFKDYARLLNEVLYD